MKWLRPSQATARQTAKFSRNFLGKKSISLIVWAFWRVREIERATRCENSSLLRRLATTKRSKKRFGKKSIFLGFGNRFFVIFPGFLRESTILGVKINFLVKFCSRYTYSEVRATKNCEKTICAARTWPPRAPPTRAQIYIYGMSMVFF